MFVSTKTETILWLIPVSLDASHKQTSLDRQLPTLPPSHTDATCPWRYMLTHGISSSNI